MGGESNAELVLGPRWLYPAKALVTRARSAAFFYGPRRGRVAPGTRFLFYHRVVEAEDELAVTPRAFAAQMEALARAGYRAVSLDEAVASLGRNERVIGLSFDDGYADVADQAAPVLERHGFTATVFVATRIVDGSARLSWYGEQPRVLGWDEIRDLDRGSPLRFEAHTLTHPNLVRLDDETARREIADSRDELAERLGRPVEGFCYPGGVYGPRERALAAGAGFAWATTCEPGANDASTDRHALRRIQIDARDGLLDFRAKLLGGHDHPPPLRSLYRRVRYGDSASA